MYSDSDHAGCVRTRRSTSCTMAMLGKHCLRATSTTQNTIAQSSAESEFYAAVKSTSIGLGFVSLCEDLGMKFPNAVEIRIDASACLGIAARRGAGQIRHIATPTLWLQQAVHQGKVAVTKVKGTLNPVDLGTKHVDQGIITSCWKTMDFESRKGAGSNALKAAITS